MKKCNKLTAALLTATMVLGLAACGNNTEESSESSSTTSSASSQTVQAYSSETAEESTGITFPLEEEVTFTFMVKDSDGQLLRRLESNELWQEMYEKTNVKIEIIALPGTDTMSSLNGMFTAGTEGDVIATSFTDNEMIQLANSGLLQPLNDYVFDAELMPNFNERVLADSPNMSAIMSFPDGSVYCMPSHNSLKGTYLESCLWINKTWLDQLEEEVPETIEDFERVLRLFTENDMNGNGKDDEIGILVKQGSAYSSFEALLGMWGIPTKDGTYENYVYVEDGEVIFAPTSETWKEAIKTFNRWYEEGLIWDECFTATNETYTAKITGEEMSFGVYTYNAPPVGHNEEYVQMLPPSIEGYDTRWYLHPGIMGSHGSFAVTRSCENVDILMAWLDQFYSFETSVQYRYGVKEYNGIKVWDYDAEGKIEYYSKSTEDYNIWWDECRPLTGIMTIASAFNSEDYEERLSLTSASDALKNASYELYEPVLNTELWPRPYMDESVSTRLAELRTDIFNTLNERKAAWITGIADIDADWDSYLESMKKMGIEEFVSVMQDAYDTFQANLQ